LKTKPYLWRIEVVVLASLVATPLQAQSLAGGYSDVVGLGAMGGIIVFLLAWTHSLRRQLRRVAPTTGTRDAAPVVPSQANAPAGWADEHEILLALQEHASDHIYFKDRQSRFRWCCKAVCDRFGVSQQGIVGKSDFDFYDDSHSQQAFDDEQEILRTGMAFHGKVEREGSIDGRERWALTSKMPLRNKAGEIIGTFGISKDITDLKRTEMQLAYERDLLTVLMDSTPDFIYFKDLQSRFVRASRVLAPNTNCRPKTTAPTARPRIWPAQLSSPHICWARPILNSIPRSAPVAPSRTSRKSSAAARR
jgi:PAS domain S-box-containing protein